MAKAEIKMTDDKIQNDENTGKAVRISIRHREILEKGRQEINRDQTYKKKISFTRYIEKLIEDYWEKPVEELKQEREGAKDWLEVEYKREAPNMSFFDWLRLRIEQNQKKSSKRNNGGEKC